MLWVSLLRCPHLEWVMVPHCPQKVTRVGMLDGAGSASTDFPLTLCSSCPTCKSSEQSCGHNSFYCFGQGKGFFACKHSKKTCVWLPSKWSVWHLWVNERAALALELDFKTQNLERNVANVMLPKPPLVRIYIENDPVELQQWMVLQFSRMELCPQPRAT